MAGINVEEHAFNLQKQVSELQKEIEDLKKESKYEKEIANMVGCYIDKNAEHGIVFYIKHLPQAYELASEEAISWKLKEEGICL